jgi:hypothetical protein
MIRVDNLGKALIRVQAKGGGLMRLGNVFKLFQMAKFRLKTLPVYRYRVYEQQWLFKIKFRSTSKCYNMCQSKMGYVSSDDAI